MRHLWIIPLLCLLAAAARAEPPEKPLILGPEPPTLKPVSTLEDLKKLDPLPVGQANIRLAIESDKVPLGTGLLVYCLWDGKGAPPNGITRREGQEKLLGPCTLRIKRIYENQEQPRINEAVNRQKSSLRHVLNGDALFVASVLPTEAGNYEITILSSVGDLIARARITCTHDEHNPYPHWRALAPAEFKTKNDAVYLPAAPMIPKWDDAVLTDPPRNLPTFIPAEDPKSPPAINAAIAGGRITLSSKIGMFDEIPETLLLRVFINGQPATTASAEQQNRQVEVAHQFRIVKELQLTLSQRPEDYGAQPGDAVDVQFLYSTGGAEPVPNARGAELRKARFAFDDSIGVRISNKIPLIPGTKQKPPATQPATAPARQ